MANKIKVGVFWVCDDGGELEIIYDYEEYDPDWKSDFGDEFIVYEKEHSTVWNQLAQKFYDGKYANYAYTDFPRGRVTFDSEYDPDFGAYMVDYDVKLKPALAAGLKEVLVKIFAMKKRVWQADKTYKSKLGKFNVR